MVLEKTLESPLDCKEIQPVHPKGNQPWDFFGRNDAEAETPVLWPPHAKSWLCCWEGLGAGGKGDDRGWDGWMASPTRWTWVWVNSRRWWWRGRPGVLRFMGSQRVRHDWVTELNWTELRHIEQVWSQGLLGSLSRWSMEWHTQVWPRIYRVKGYNNLGEEICHGPLCVPLHSYWGWPWLIFTQVISQHCVYTTLEDEVMYLSGTKNRLTNCLLLKRMVN